MMIILGLDTMMASVETTITSILDIFPYLKKTTLRKVSAISAICFFFMAWGILFCLQSGTYWVGKLKYASLKILNDGVVSLQSLSI
jgi:hypothetical protein